MRVKELADLAGTTVRTIRYYHQIGLLPVPERIGGVRDYGMVQLARLVRIRWLVGSGVPLVSVRAMIEESGDDPDERNAIRTDLAVTLAGVDERIGELGRQRQQLVNLLRTTGEGGPVSPMPRAVHEMYDRLLARAGDPEVAALIAAERQVVEFACYRTELPSMITDLAEHLTDEQLDLILPLFIEFRDLSRSVDTLPEAERLRRVEEMAEHSVDFLAALDLTPGQVRGMLEQASQSSGEYVGYATTQLFPEDLQKSFMHELESGLLERGLLPPESKGAVS
ncbi:MerR family transcriptional regulator [Flexivirga oryzae]|uniref:DNA-binding transcriptional MerR regulator n=1 Tax=Flexivirga oryzae TaxID=1794944 RepID=A0A839N5T3_9MICO|nr:MerR family transcriptional regulator [Flexivirga oryzae]MBB2892637.1 DNA-binding transcriptional MerR regulator [Flexivirga oryzae]MBB2894686.1 DNA-binding transcriptional MerR regulator [Flexivirga oryzae]